jgi:hypothetical protein
VKDSPKDSSPVHPLQTFLVLAQESE